MNIDKSAKLCYTTKDSTISTINKKTHKEAQGRTLFSLGLLCSLTYYKNTKTLGAGAKIRNTVSGMRDTEEHHQSKIAGHWSKENT